MTNVVEFNFGINGVRTVEIEGDAWFVLRDVLNVMASSTTTSNAKSRIRAEIGHHAYSEHPLETSGGIQKITIINEDAVIFLLLRSKGSKSDVITKSIISQIAGSKAIIKALQDFEVPDDLPDMFVYAIRESESGRIKIGISRDPEVRLKQLQTGNSQKLELVAYRKAENRYQDESATQLMVKEHHIRGEWFSEDAQKITEKFMRKTA